MRTVLMCPKCGDIIFPITEREDECIACKHCGSKRIKIDADAEKMYELPQAELKIYKERLCRKHLFNLPTFDEDAYESRIQKYQELETRLCKEVEQDKLNTPKCPYCKSVYVEKITTGGRLISTALFGLGSSKVGKQWHCKQCGSNY